MNAARSDATAVVLPDSQVLIAGGVDASTEELYTQLGL
jgi:hypothetical protein